MCPRGPGVPRPLRPLCQCPRSSVRAPSSAASAAPGAPGKRRTHPALAQGSLVGKEGVVVGPGDRLEPQILDDSRYFIPGKRRTDPHCCPRVIGQQRGDDGCSREGLEPQNLDNSCCFSLLSRGWEINGQWACSDGVTGKPLPFLCLQSPARMASARCGCDLSPSREGSPRAGPCPSPNRDKGPPNRDKGPLNRDKGPPGTATPLLPSATLPNSSCSSS